MEALGSMSLPVCQQVAPPAAALKQQQCSRFSTHMSLFSSTRPGRPSRPPVRELTPQEAEEVQYAFSLFDPDKKGWIRPREVKIALRALGFEMKKGDLVTILGSMTGSDDVQQVDYDMFERIMMQQYASRKPEDVHARAFELLDLDGQGGIDFRTLRRVVKHLQQDISDTELREMIEEFDRDMDGMINKEEFMIIMQNSMD